MLDNSLYQKPMGLIYEKLVKPVLFTQDPERAHELAVFGLKAMGGISSICKMMADYNRTDAAHAVDLFGLSFPNRVGIAAGIDKNAECWNAFAALGFGHVEVGTVTAHRQPGNPKPRMHRFLKEEALINSMGFNNDGADAVAQRLAKDKNLKKKTIPLGINIGKSKAIPLEHAAEDYVQSFNLLADYADYFAINVSSPNTKGLRVLQSEDHIRPLLAEIRKANLDRAKKMGTEPLPMLVKISPDLGFREIDHILETISDLEFDGIVATNTTLSRPGNLGTDEQNGGVSGRPLQSLTLKVVKYISLATGGNLPIIGCGGVMDAESAGKLIDVGASLVQIYTGLIFKGPLIGRDVARGLAWSQRDWV